MTYKYIKYNGSQERVLSCYPEKRGKADILDSVYEICEEAFIDCKHITEIKFPASLAYINKGAFKDCSGLTEVVFPIGLIGMLSDAFANCYNLKSVKFLRSFGEIPDYCFS